VLRDFNSAQSARVNNGDISFAALFLLPQSSDVSDARRQCSFVLGPDVVSFR
jgi:hypothetical protein